MKLSNRIDLYIPETSGHEQDYRETMSLLAEICGGSTETVANGSWVDENGELIFDKVHLVYAYYNSLNVKDIRRILKHVHDVKARLNQTLMSIGYNGTLHLT